MMRIDVIESPEAFEKLAEAWQSLSQRVSKSRFSQTHDWALAGWRLRSEGAMARLKCLTVWQDNRLVGVWAFKRVQKGMVSHLVPLGTELGEEYAEPLLEDTVDTPAICGQILDELKRHGDVLNLHFLGRGTSLCEAAGRCKRPHIQYVSDAFVIDPTGYESWDAFIGSYSKNMRMQLRRSMNRLLAMGTVELVRAENEAQAREISDWLLTQKQNWLKARHIRRDWFYQERSAAFLRETAIARNPTGHGALFALKLDDKIIAATVNTVDQVRVEGMILTFDPDYAHYSPGMLILQETTRWAYERGLMHDLRINTQDYKQRWVTHKMTHDTFVVGMTTLGALSLTPQWGKDLIKDQIRARLSPQAIAMLKSKARSLWGKRPQETEADVEATPA